MQIPPNLIHTIKTKIAQGKTQEVFTLLQAQKLEGKQSKTLTILQSEFQTLTQAQQKGTLSFDDTQLRKNQISKHAIIDFLYYNFPAILLPIL